MKFLTLPSWIFRDVSSTVLNATNDIETNSAGNIKYFFLFHNGMHEESVLYIKRTYFWIVIKREPTFDVGSPYNMYYWTEYP